MSLTLSPYGLSFVEYKGGKNRMSTSQYTIASGYAFSIGQGDPVQVAAAGGNVQAYTPPTTPTPPAMGLASFNIVGVACSFSWVSSTGVAMRNQPYWPGGTLTLNNVPAIVTVEDPTDNIYKIQCNASLGLTSPSTACFKNYSMSSCQATTLPNPRTSQSTAVLNVSSYTASPNYWLSLKIVGLAPQSLTGGPNSWYDTYPEVLVIVNSHVYKSGTNGI